MTSKRLLQRQVSLLRYLTSGGAIFGDGGPLDPDLRGVDGTLLRMEARFSHEKRMEKIAAVFPRTFDLLGSEREALIREFVDACPPVDIARLANARQFHDFLSARWRRQPPRRAYLPDVAACELACAQARAQGWPVHDFRSGRRVTLIALPVAAGAGALAGGIAAGVALHRRTRR